MSKEEKNYKKENEKRMLIALAVLLGYTKVNKIDEFENLTDDQQKEVKKIFKERNLKAITDNPQRLDEKTIQIESAKKGIDDNSQLYRIVGTKDNRTCPDCAVWQGQIVSMVDDGIHKSVQDFIKNHGFHINCRCSLQKIKTDEIPLKTKINPRYDQRKTARPDLYNSAPIHKVTKSNIYIQL